MNQAGQEEKRAKAGKQATNGSRKGKLQGTCGAKQECKILRNASEQVVWDIQLAIKTTCAKERKASRVPHGRRRHLCGGGAFKSQSDTESESGITLGVTATPFRHYARKAQVAVVIRARIDLLASDDPQQCHIKPDISGFPACLLPYARTSIFRPGIELRAALSLFYTDESDVF